jgi:prepilin-type N-terminal cleavage/methylation domain-containing protein
MNYIFKSVCYSHKKESGFSLIEIVVALGILAAVAVVFLVGMETSSKAVMVSRESVTVESLAKSQIERIKSWVYDTNNPPNYQAAILTNLPTGYSIQIAAVRLDPENDGLADDDGLQRITVTVTSDDGSTFLLVGYKVRP